MKIAIIGAGAMGCRFGAAFKEAGQEVWLYDIWKEHINKINNDGLKVNSDEGATVYQMKATMYPDEIGKVDCCCIFTKAIHTQAAMEDIKNILNQNTRVMTLQNGLGNIETIAKYTDKINILAGVTNYASDLLGPGEIEAKGSGCTKIMNIKEVHDDILHKIVIHLKQGGINTEITDDVIKEIWHKVAFNAAFNTVTSITKLRVKDIGNTEEAVELIKKIVSEINEIALEKGISFSEEVVLETIFSVFDPDMSGDHITSMLQDVLKQKKTEIDAITGQIIKESKNTGIQAPYNTTMYYLIKTVEKNYENQIHTLNK